MQSYSPATTVEALLRRLLPSRDAAPGVASIERIENARLFQHFRPQRKIRNASEAQRPWRFSRRAAKRAQLTRLITHVPLADVHTLHNLWLDYMDRITPSARQPYI
jgi:hypothetical protein